ncbi:hypothetical protein H5410_042174 [Solanum commersonii]|uniref:Uncharacterized protein n=1 Tax=Solanum commersonii TaxID=4109 RepID=A0A9J5XWT4_SOLCO|nr:hypothetical protein H5410_042174 [Solanum commersonii]
MQLIHFISYQTTSNGKSFYHQSTFLNSFVLLNKNHDEFSIDVQKFEKSYHQSKEKKEQERKAKRKRRRVI